MATVRHIDELPNKAALSAVAGTLREVLTSLAGRQRLPNDDLEVLFAEVDAKLGTLPKRSWVFEVLDRVIGKNAQRKRDAIFVVLTLASAPGGEARLLRYVDDPNAAVRLEVFGAIHRQRWVHLAPRVSPRSARRPHPRGASRTSRTYRARGPIARGPSS